MNDTEFFPWALEIFDQIEGSEEFKNLDPVISKYFYHVFIKIKRNYLAINHLFKGEWENSYIESIPLIRILAEGYFHFCYIIEETNKSLIPLGYNKLAELQSYTVAKNYNDLGTNLLPEEEEFVRKHYNEIKVEPNPPLYLSRIKRLVKKTHNEYLYTRVYNAFSSYVHFNPATSVIYGTQMEDRFVFNNIKENEPLVDSLKSHTDGIIMLFFTKLIDYLKIESLHEEFNKYYDEDKKVFKFKH
ncbi:DUF5677 domain-containing protein [Neobacillus sp. BF23-41]|uniref:DUF5677 domain-containing protein n=1 Tax=Neobacillus sp. BF23-41 TaxID=3240280 RepID=UPI0034E5EBD9